MRRAPIVLTATVLGTAGVLLFKPLPTSALAGGTATATGAASSSSGTAASDSASSGTEAGNGTAEATPSGTASTGAAKDGTFTGDAQTVRFGTTQVQVVISAGEITDVVVVQENQNDSRSVQISENAFPTLRSAVLQQQTAAVDTVSGATWTSAQYEASLQSALDQAGFTAPDGSTASTDLSTVQESGPGGGFGH